MNLNETQKTNNNNKSDLTFNYIFDIVNIDRIARKSIQKSP